MATSTYKAPPPLRATDLAALPPAKRAAYFNSLPDTRRTQEQQAYQVYVARQNNLYMRQTLRKWTVLPQASSNAISQNWTAGQSLVYNLVTSNNAFTEEIVIRCVLSLTPATGTSAVYALNAGVPYTVIDSVIITYNGTQVRLRPYIMKYVSQLMGYERPKQPSTVIAGQDNATMDTYLNSGVPFTVGSANNWTFDVHIPLNLVNPLDPRGLLPTMGRDTIGQVAVNCANGLLGNDPILNIAAVVSGTGHSITCTGTVQVFAIYRDGEALASPDTMALDLSGLGTVQMAIDAPLAGLGQGSTFRQKIGIMGQIWLAIATVVDGQQATKFSTMANFNSVELDKDQAGQNKFWFYGSGSNIPVQQFWANIRYLTGQDLDEGIVPLVMGNVVGTSDPSNRDGIHYLNTDVGGWTDVHAGYNLITTSSPLTGVNPRVETHLFYVNNKGLIAV